MYKSFQEKSLYTVFDFGFSQNSVVNCQVCGVSNYILTYKYVKIILLELKSIISIHMCN